MEEILNKVKYTFSSAASNAVSIASQVQQYLPGNPIYREYDVTTYNSSAGRGLIWKVYSGHKKSNKEEVSVFIFEKKQIDKIGKTDRENILNILRKGVSQLTRLKHPQILTIEHPLEESRELIAFATEPVFASLANILNNNSHLDGSLPAALQQYTLHNVEIKYGILQLSEGLSFLHESVKMVHGCVTPENIIVNKQGVWKLFGFDFCVANTGSSHEPVWIFEDYDCTEVKYLQLDLDYMAPEYVASHSIDPKVDIFSLGVSIYALHNNGKPLHQYYNDYSCYRKRAFSLEKVSNLELANVPTELKAHLNSLLKFNPCDRPTATCFSKISYFNDISVNTLRYLDKIIQLDNLQKSEFYKKLPRVIPHLPHRMTILRVIPSLNNECVNATMVPFVLPVMLQVADTASEEEFRKHILIYLKPIMKLAEPIQITLLLLQKIELLLSKTPSEAIESDIFPFVFRAIECKTQQIQELCLTCIPMCVVHCLQNKLRAEFLPRIRKLCLQTDYLSVRVSCLICIGKVIPRLDKSVIPGDIFEFLCQVPSKESAVVMAIVGIYQVVFHHKSLGISKEILGNNVIPSLIPLSIENSLSVNQHSTIMSLVKEMINKVEEDHRQKLMQLEEAKIEQESLKMQIPGMTPLNDTSESFLETQQKSNSDFLDNKFGTAAGSNQVLSLSTKLAVQMDSISSEGSLVLPQKGPNRQQEMTDWSARNFSLNTQHSSNATQFNQPLPPLTSNISNIQENTNKMQQLDGQTNYKMHNKKWPVDQLPLNFGRAMSKQPVNNSQDSHCKSLSAAEINEFLQ